MSQRADDLGMTGSEANDPLAHSVVFTNSAGFID